MSNTQDLNRRQQFAQSYRMAKKTDPALPWWMLGGFVVGAALGALIFWLIPPRGGVFDWILTGLGAFMFGGLLALVIFSRRAQRAAYDQLEGRPGAAAAALSILKRGWKVDQVVAFTKQQDLMHRVVGKPGIVLVGEGNPGRLNSLLLSERKKYERICPETPVHEVIVGDGDGQVPLRKLAGYVQKLPKGIEPAQMTEVLNRLKAVDARRANIPIPKGPVPTSMKGQRGNLRGR